MLSRTGLLLRARRPQVVLHKVVNLLELRGINASSWKPADAKDLQRDKLALFAPLFSNGFVFENNQLTTFGDTLVDHYLAQRMAEYCLAMGVVCTSNTAKQINAVFHNHFVMRMFSEELGFQTLPHDQLAVDEKTPTGECLTLSDLECSESGPRPTDLLGTTFAFSPLPAGQSALGWKFSHFIGAVHQTYGRDAVDELLDNLYQLKGSSNLGGAATKLLLKIVERFGAMNVAEALLAAQGVPAEFFAKTVFLESRGDKKTAADSGTTRPSEQPQHHHGGESDQTVGDVAQPLQRTGRSQPAAEVQGFGSDLITSAAEAALAKEMVDAAARASPLAGPGVGLDALGTWRRREAARLSVAEKDMTSIIPEGWLDPAEQAKAKRGPAFEGFVDFSLVPSFADVVGQPHPENGKRVGRVAFTHPVRDKPFFDTVTEFRNGVPIDTNGLPLPEFLKLLNSPHERRFEVSLIVRGDTVLGRSISSRYTEARRGACQGYLMAVARDLERLNSAQSDEDA